MGHLYHGYVTNNQSGFVSLPAQVELVASTDGVWGPKKTAEFGAVSNWHIPEGVPFFFA